MSNETEPTTPIDPLTIGPLLTLPEASESSGFSSDYLRQVIKRGRLKGKKVGRDWLTTMAAIEEYKNSRSFKNIPKKYRDNS